MPDPQQGNRNGNDGNVMRLPGGNPAGQPPAKNCHIIAICADPAPLFAIKCLNRMPIWQSLFWLAHNLVVLGCAHR